MGYRALLKKYIRAVELQAGDNFIESAAAAPEAMLDDRDLGELRSVAAEIFREAHADPAEVRVANCNYRLRLLLNRFGLSLEDAATIAGVEVDTVRRWRTHPHSRRYLPMTEAEFTAFEARLRPWLDGDRPRQRRS